jgi:hypothetical protein
MSMETTHDIEPGRRIDLSCEVVGLDRDDRSARLVPQTPGQRPQRIDGLTIGAPMLTSDPPHNGEMHPDGDRTVELRAGDAIVVPKGIWHKVTLREPGQLIHITPGPGGDARPLSR